MVLCPPFFKMARQDMNKQGLQKEVEARLKEHEAQQAEAGTAPGGDEAGQDPGDEADPAQQGSEKGKPKGHKGIPLNIDEYRFTASLLVEAFARSIGGSCKRTLVARQPGRALQADRAI